MSGATAISREGCRFNDHQATPNGPRSLAGSAGHDCRPSRTGTTVKGTRTLSNAGAITLRDSGGDPGGDPAKGSKPSGNAGMNSMTARREVPFRKTNAAPSVRPRKPRGGVSTSALITALRTKNASTARPISSSPAGICQSGAKSGSRDHNPAIASTAVRSARMYARCARCMQIFPVRDGCRWISVERECRRALCERRPSR